MEEGTTNGTVTDVNGKYSISVSAKSTLVFSCIGYKEQEIRVGTKTVLNVNMVEAVSYTHLGMIPRSESMIAFSMTRNMLLSQGLITICLLYTSFATRPISMIIPI